LITDFPIEEIDYRNLGKIIFTSDLLRIDDRERDVIPNPQRMNVDWIHSLIWPKLERFLAANNSSLQAESVLGDEECWQSLRVKLYERLSLEMNTDSWAKLYSGEQNFDAVAEAMKGLFQDTLVIGYEIPPYLLKYLNAGKIPYIDLHVHPVRFLPDYMFGIRTNVRAIAELLNTVRLPESFMYEHADILKARSARVFFEPIENGSVLFLGQTSTDASLIAGKRMMRYNDLEANLINLCMQHRHVYYKKHPHLEPKAEKRLRSLIDNIKNCTWLEANIYDALGAPQFTTVAALSSGGLVEARYFSKKTIRLLESSQHLEENGQPAPDLYMPIYEHPLKSRLWEDVLQCKSAEPADYSYQYQGELLKSSLNIVWGR